MEDNVFELYLRQIKNVIDFYSPYFQTTADRDKFVNQIFLFDCDEKKPRQMFFQIQRFVTLANEIDRIYPARDGLRILFLKCCLESLAKLSGLKKKEFFKMFLDCFSNEGRTYILEHFKLVCFGYTKNEIEHEWSYDLTLGDFFNVVKVIRDMVVHEGNYWEAQLFACDEESTWISQIETEEKVILSYEYPVPKERFTYSFETTLQYDKFIFYFVDACVKFIIWYMESKQLSVKQI